jgi:hypothetical protein
MNKKEVGLLVIIIILIGVIIFLLQRPLKKIAVTEPVVDNSETIVTNNSKSTEEKNSPTQCVTGYEQTTESKVVLEESPVLITKVEKKCDGYYYATVDYLGPREGDPVSGNGSFYTNKNLALRTFKVSQSTAVIALVNDYNEKVLFAEYNKQLTSRSYNLFGRTGVLMRQGASSPVYNIKVQNGEVISLQEVYLP